MTQHVTYRVSVQETATPGEFIAAFLSKETGEVVGDIIYKAVSREAALAYAAGYCTAFYRAGLPVQFRVPQEV